MNNISGFIQPSMFSQPSVLGIVPQSMPMPMPMPMPVITSGGRVDIMTIVIISTVVVMVLFLLYRNMSISITDKDDDSELSESFKKSHFDNDNNNDPLSKCGWEVVVSETCPYCVQQKQILSTHFPNFKNISTNKPVEAVPTWINNKTGQMLPGLKTYDALMEMIIC